MKKLILILVITLCYELQLQAAVRLNNIGQTDSTKISKQIKKLNLKLADLKNQLIDTRSQVPIDSVKWESITAKSHDAQLKSKKRSAQAVGGNLDDVKLAEKQAKISARQMSDAVYATKQLERGRKKLKKLTKEIKKTQQELDKVQATQ